SHRGGIAPHRAREPPGDRYSDSACVRGARASTKFQGASNRRSQRLSPLFILLLVTCPPAIALATAGHLSLARVPRASPPRLHRRLRRLTFPPGLTGGGGL